MKIYKVINNRPTYATAELKDKAMRKGAYMLALFAEQYR